MAEKEKSVSTSQETQASVANDKVEGDSGKLAEVNPERGATGVALLHNGEWFEYELGQKYRVPAALLNVKDSNGVAYLSEVKG